MPASGGGSEGVAIDGLQGAAVGSVQGAGCGLRHPDGEVLKVKVGAVGEVERQAFNVAGHANFGCRVQQLRAPILQRRVKRVVGRHARLAYGDHCLCVEGCRRQQHSQHKH